MRAELESTNELKIYCNMNPPSANKQQLNPVTVSGTHI